MEKKSSTPTISHEESERRRRAVEEARASNFRQGYVHDQVLEEANTRFIRGLISLEELRAEMRQAIQNDCLSAQECRMAIWSTVIRIPIRPKIQISTMS